MSGVNRILTFCGDGVVGTNLLSDSAYKSSQQRLTGNVGAGNEQLFNKAQHQAAWMANIIAEWMANGSGKTITDSMDVAEGTKIINDTFQGGSFPPGTKAIFYHRGAPTGWTQDVRDAADNRMLRVTSTDSGTGGSDNPTIMDKVPQHVHYAITGKNDSKHFHEDENSVHWHGQGPESMVAGHAESAIVQLDNISLNDQDHTHSGVTDVQNPAGAWRPKFVKTIVCIKD